MLLSAPWSVLCYYAEEISLRVPLQVKHLLSSSQEPVWYLLTGQEPSPQDQMNGSYLVILQSASETFQVLFLSNRPSFSRVQRVSIMSQLPGPEQMFRKTVLTCPHLSSPVFTCPHLSSPVLTCPHLSSPVLTHPLPVLTCPHLSSPVLTHPLPVLTCLHLSSPVFTCPHLSSCRWSTLRSLTGLSASCPSCPSAALCLRTSPTLHLTTTPVSSGATSCRGTHSSCRHFESDH